MNDRWYTARELAGLPGMPRAARYIRILASRRGWASRRRQGRGGGREYSARCLPESTRLSLLAQELPPPSVAPSAELRCDSDQLWRRYERLSSTARERAARRHQMLLQLAALVDAGTSLERALRAASLHSGRSVGSLRRWWYQVRPYARSDWLAALADGHRGRASESQCDPAAWDWLLSYYLTRRRPTFSTAYRRLQEVAAGRGWHVPRERALRRRLEREVSVHTRTFLRDGPEALRRLYPAMERRKGHLSAGEAVSGDGLKFDRLWVRWGDDVINTTTAWIWQDIYSGRILAHRVAQTENTDLFRLATYDLCGICVPAYAQVDNTTVAANKAMTGRAPGRHRFRDRAEDPIGILVQLGIDVHFTHPDQTLSNPGVKPVERAFGTGGIHEAVASHPKLLDRGHSRATAIPAEEFCAILAEEIVRFNARPGRRSPVCAGRSFDQTFRESFERATVRRATEAQRRLLLLMPEVVRTHRETGEIALQAGRGPDGRHRYWSEALARHAGEQLVAYYDPADLTRPISVYALDGRPVCEADHLAARGFDDTSSAREWGKQKRRALKAQRAAAAAQRRMQAIEVASLYPHADGAEPPPEPGVVRGNFGQRRRVQAGRVVGGAQPEPDPEYAEALDRVIGPALKRLREDSI